MNGPHHFVSEDAGLLALVSCTKCGVGKPAVMGGVEVVAGERRRFHGWAPTSCPDFQGPPVLAGGMLFRPAGRGQIVTAMSSNPC